MISDFKNRHHGETCIIIGNGPSLRYVPRSFIEAFITFGQNKCYLNAPPLVNFTPNYYVTSDPDNDIDRSIVDKMPCVKFTKEGSGFINTHEFRLTREHIFSKHPDIVLYEGYSVTYISLQLAYYMGFTTVLLIGVDHRYKPYDASKEHDPNHYTRKYKGKTDFDPEALAKGELYIAEAMLLAKTTYENDGRRIINLTQGSNLKVFQIDNINNWIYA